MYNRTRSKITGKYLLSVLSILLLLIRKRNHNQGFIMLQLLYFTSNTEYLPKVQSFLKRFQVKIIMPLSNNVSTISLKISLNTNHCKN